MPNSALTLRARADIPTIFSAVTIIPPTTTTASAASAIEKLRRLIARLGPGPVVEFSYFIRLMVLFYGLHEILTLSNQALSFVSIEDGAMIRIQVESDANALMSVE